MRKVAVVAVLCLLPLCACREEPTGRGKVSVRTTSQLPPGRVQTPGSAQTLGNDVSTLLGDFQEANASYHVGEISREERARKAEELEQQAWQLIQGAKELADKVARSENDPKRKAYGQELESFLLLYLEDLHASLCAERLALQTGKAQWNKRARAHADLLPSLANSIRALSGGSISFPRLSPGPGRLPSPPPPPSVSRKAGSNEPAGKAKAASSPARKVNE